MNKSTSVGLCLILFLILVMAFYPETALAQFGAGAFESRMQGLTTKLITVLLPLMSIIALIYAVFLALMGDGAAKGRIFMVICVSVVGVLAPYLIRWFQSAAGQ